MALDARERAAFRNAVCARDLPRAALVTAGVVVAATFANAAVGQRVAPAALLANGLVGGLLVLVAVLGRHARLPDRFWPWLIAASAAVLVGAGQVQVYLDPSGSSFANVLVVMVAYAPLTLAWWPALAAAAPMLVGSVALAQRWAGTERSDWVVAAATAVAVGLAMMWLRMRTIDELADMTAATRAQATRDELTGLLNRHGVRSRVPELVGLAARRGEPVGVAFLDVRGLKSANDHRGHEFGDVVLQAVAAALREVARSSDVVGRWGGDEFVVVGLGGLGDAAAFERRILASLAAADADAGLGEFLVGVSVGTASDVVGAGEEGVAAVDTLIAAADADMYRRRTARAGEA